MPGRDSEFSQSQLERWLVELGFSRGNPFATAEADQERALLPEFFVEVEGYEDIKSDKTIVVFAPRGGGKSALRVALSAQFAPLVPTSSTLAVEFADFGTLISIYRDRKRLSVDDYLPSLLRCGIKSLMDTLCGDPFGLGKEKMDRSPEYNLRRATTFSASARFRLARAISKYYPEFLQPDKVYEHLCSLTPAHQLTWDVFYQSAISHHLCKMVESTHLQANPIARLLAELNDLQKQNQASSTAETTLEKMSSFVPIAEAGGLTTTMFLIDRLDEHEETANSPEAQADILEPLLAELPLLEMPGIAFKFFLSKEAHDILLTRGKTRRDRLTDAAVTVQWSSDRLKRLIDERLSVYSDGGVHDLTQLCSAVPIKTRSTSTPVRLGEWIEGELLRTAQGSPRRFLTAAQLLCRAHIRRAGAKGLIEKEDWEQARSELMQKMPPKLQVRIGSSLVCVGEREVTLTDKEQEIIQALIEGNGKCNREVLVEKVWRIKDGVEPDTVNQAISRLRERLGDDASNPIFLFSERKTIWLENYVVKD